MTTTNEISSKLEQHSSQICLVVSAYFLSLVLGLFVLLNDQAFLMLGYGADLILMLWIICPTSVLLFVIWSAYKPLANVIAWLEKYAGEE